MFDNAWLYNKKTSRVYKFCTKVTNYEIVLTSHLQTCVYNYNVQLHVCRHTVALVQCISDMLLI